MGLFGKKKEARKITVRFDGKENDLIWKQEILDCDCECEIVADAFYKVVYLKNGRIMEDMSADRFTVNTNAKKEKDQEVFDVRVYYVNVNNAYTVKWGTRQQARVIDGFFQVPVSLGASGSFKITVENAHKLVAKLCSMRSDLDTAFIQEFFGEQMTMYVMQTLTREIQSGRTNAYTLWSNAADVAANMQSELKDIFLEYGIKVSGFAISAIVMPQEEIRQFEEILRKRRLLEMQDTSFREEAANRKAEKKDALEAVVKLAEIDAKKAAPTVNIHNHGSELGFCPYCGAKRTGGGAFCASCGKKLS